MTREANVINFEEKLAKFSDTWSPRVISELNDSYVKLVKCEGDFCWHTHENEDELFMVVSGELVMELRDKTLTLRPGEMCVIPKGVEHFPRVNQDTNILIIETKTVVSTGAEIEARTKQPAELEWV